MALLALAASLGAQAVTLPPEGEELSAEQVERYQVLIHELRCLVCQNQTIADSNAELAADLRNQVHARIASGETDAQIRRYVTDRYSDFVLYKPPLSGRTLMLWAGPFVLLAVALLVVALRFGRKWNGARDGAAPPSSADAERLSRLLDEERP